MLVVHGLGNSILFILSLVVSGIAIIFVQNGRFFWRFPNVDVYFALGQHDLRIVHGALSD